MPERLHRRVWIERRSAVDPAPLFVAAATSYVINCALGTAVASRVLNTGRFRWIHHALYVSTATLTTAAVSSLVWSRSRAGWTLLPAGIPLSVIPYVSARTRRHPALALSAAPFYVAGLIHVRRYRDGVP